jgi:hypothetical protein
MKKVTEINWRELSPLRWPQGLGRTLIGDRQNRAAYTKKQLSIYVKSIIDELKLLGADNVEITYNQDRTLAQKDPGVAVWYSLTKPKDTSWQTVLRIDNPSPTIDEITKAFKRLVMESKCHPDQVAAGSGGDIKVYMKLEEAWRNAKRYVSGDMSYGLTNCLPCDMFVEVRQNMACLKLQLMHLRAMQRLGNPFVVERIMERGFREALPAPPSEVPVGSSAA